MKATSYAMLAAALFAIISVLQLVRALAGWPVTVGGTMIPVWVSWIAFVVAGVLAWTGFIAAANLNANKPVLPVLRRLIAKVVDLLRGR